MAKENRGFAAMNPTKQREIASKGGKAAHLKGTAHQWSGLEAREAGRRGGLAHRRRTQQEGVQESVPEHPGVERMAPDIPPRQVWPFDR